MSSVKRKVNTKSKKPVERRVTRSHSANPVNNGITRSSRPRNQQEEPRSNEANEERPLERTSHGEDSQQGVAMVEHRPSEELQRPIVPNGGPLLVGDGTSLKQLEGEPILTYSLRILDSFKGSNPTEAEKMDLFKKNLLSNLQQELELENNRKKFATFTGMACFLEQRVQALAKPDNIPVEPVQHLERAQEENTLINEMISENDRLRRRLSQEASDKSSQPRHLFDRFDRMVISILEFIFNMYSVQVSPTCVHCDWI